MSQKFDFQSYGVQELTVEASRDIIGGGPLFWQKVGNFFKEVWAGIKAGLGIKD